MRLVELNIERFTNFQKTHPLSNYYQTVNYALLMAENGYDYDLIGYLDDYDNIIAASLILIKPIKNKYYYGYAPRGFLIDYNNEYLVSKFTEDLKNYYSNKKVVFIKINPNLAIGEVNISNYETTYNNNQNIKNILSKYDYKKLKDNMLFEAMLPRFNAFIDIKNFNIKNSTKNTRNKVFKSSKKGLVFKKYSKEYISEFYRFIKNKKNHDEFYYQDYYTVFEKDNNIDLFLVSIDYFEFLRMSEEKYNKELERNNILNKKIVLHGSEKNINSKMNSDKVLLTYKNDILEATNGISENKQVFIAGCLVIKHNNIASILLSGFDEEYKRFVPNYYLHYNLINYYKDDYDYLDLNGVVGDFKNENKYTGLNNFKLGFKPRVFEYIGEYDLIINKNVYESLLYSGFLTKEFKK